MSRPLGHYGQDPPHFESGWMHGERFWPQPFKHKNKIVQQEDNHMMKRTRNGIAISLGLALLFSACHEGDVGRVTAAKVDASFSKSGEKKTPSIRRQTRRTKERRNVDETLDTMKKDSNQENDSRTTFDFYERFKSVFDRTDLAGHDDEDAPKSSGFLDFHPLHPFLDIFSGKSSGPEDEETDEGTMRNIMSLSFQAAASNRQDLVPTENFDPNFTPVYPENYTVPPPYIYADKFTPVFDIVEGEPTGQPVEQPQPTPSPTMSVAQQPTSEPSMPQTTPAPTSGDTEITTSSPTSATTLPPTPGGTGGTTLPPTPGGTGATLPPTAGATLPPTPGGTGVTLPPTGGTTLPPTPGGTGATLPPTPAGTGVTLPPTPAGTGATLPPTPAGTGATLPPTGGATMPPTPGGTGATLPPTPDGTGTVGTMPPTAGVTDSPTFPGGNLIGNGTMAPSFDQSNGMNETLTNATNFPTLSPSGQDGMNETQTAAPSTELGNATMTPSGEGNMTIAPMDMEGVNVTAAPTMSPGEQTTRFEYLSSLSSYLFSGVSQRLRSARNNNLFAESSKGSEIEVDVGPMDWVKAMKFSGEVDDGFGSVVGMSFDSRVVVVGSPNGNRGGESSGRVGVYEPFAEGKKVVWFTGSPRERLGRSVSVSSDGNVVAVGAVGFVNVYAKDETNHWYLREQLTSEEPAGFGENVAIAGDGNTIVVSSVSERFVQVFKRERSATWKQEGRTFTRSTKETGFGTSVSVNFDGSIVAIGSPGWSNTEESTVEIYRLKRAAGLLSLFGQASWEMIGEKIIGFDVNDGFGASVSLSMSGLRIAVGAYERRGIGPRYVAVFELDEEESEWMMVGQVLNSPEGSHLFGASVSLSGSGTTLAIGSTGEDNSGVVDVFDMDEKIQRWFQVGESIRRQANGIARSSSIVLSGDGKTVLTGAPLESYIEYPGIGNVCLFDLVPSF